jgi:type II secretion system protein G
MHHLRAPDADDDGFTLIELLVVIIIIGILAAIAIPVFLNRRKKAADASLKSDIRVVVSELETYFVDSQQYPAASGTDALTVFPALHLSPRNTVTITTDNVNENFCLVADGGGRATRVYVFDRNAGGFQPDTVTTC